MNNFAAIAKDLDTHRKDWRIDNDTMTRVIKRGDKEVTITIGNSTDSPRITISHEDKQNYKNSFRENIKPSWLQARVLVAAAKRWRGFFVDDLVALLATEEE